MKKIEPYFLILILVSIVLKQYNFGLADALSIFTFSATALFYYSLTVFILNDIELSSVFKKSSYDGINPIKLFAAIAIGWDFSVLILGVFFKFMLFPGGDLMLNYGLITLAVFLIIFSIFYKKTQENYFKVGLQRIFLIGSIGFVFYLINTNTLIDWRYSQHPEYAKAMKDSYNHPEDEAARQRVKELYLEIYGQK